MTAVSLNFRKGNEITITMNNDNGRNSEISSIGGGKSFMFYLLCLQSRPGLLMSGETSTNPEGQVQSKSPGPALLHNAFGSQSFKVGSKHGLFA